MSLPPERISVKRRRQEDPVDALYLQEKSSPNNQKRRFTDYYFKLLREDAITPVSQKRVQSQTSKALPDQSSAVDPNGIPTVRATAPGEEVDDFRRLLAAQKVRREQDNKLEIVTEPEVPSTNNYKSSTLSSKSPINFQNARRFHLARTLSSFHRPDSSGGIRKSLIKIRPPLPTFVERQAAILAGQDFHTKPPVDRILDAPHHTAPITNDNGSKTTRDSDLPSALPLESPGFVKPMQPKKKLGTSIRDHPSTWDLESDQLADELSALAMEMDPGSDTFPLEQPSPVVSASQKRDVADVQMTDEYVYETYIRVPHDHAAADPTAVDTASSSFGVLVVDDEDEELWQQYLDDGEDSDWDNEDSNAEDNPANDYPEEEVSSDDEFDRGAYGHRQYASDDEEYGDDYD